MESDAVVLGRQQLEVLAKFPAIEVPSLNVWMQIPEHRRAFIVKRTEVYDGHTKGHEANFALKVALAMLDEKLAKKGGT